MQNNTSSRIAIIGCGEVGLSYAKALKEAEKNIILCEAYPSQAFNNFIQQTGIETHSTIGSWLKDCDLVLSVVTGGGSLAVTHAALPYLTKDAIYADFTTASPDDKREGARKCTEKAITYVDVAIMGAIALSGAKTPLLISGKKTEKIQLLMEEIKAPVAILENSAPGDAISLKLMRSIFTKGLEALAVECLVAAESFGVREQLYSVLSDIDNASLRDFLEMLVRTHVIHAARRGHEVKTARDQLTANGLSSLVLPGVEAVFSRSAKDLDSKPIGFAQPSIQQAIAWLLTSMSENTANSARS